MKVVILAGGKGLRLRDKTLSKSKAMVEIGGKPILWHIMKYYSTLGYNEFIVGTGYKGSSIKNYFKESKIKKWNVTVVDTGIETQTGGRLRRLHDWIGEETFILSWCDQLHNVNIGDLISFHKKNNKLSTIVAVRTYQRFGKLILKNYSVRRFIDKSQISDEWIDGGVYVLEPDVLNLIYHDNTVFEKDILGKLPDMNQLVAYKHTGFWQCMDTYIEYELLNKLWQERKAPWKIW